MCLYFIIGRKDILCCKEFCYGEILFFFVVLCPYWFLGLPSLPPTEILNALCVRPHTTVHLHGLVNEELHNLCSSLNIIRIKSVG